MRSPDQANAMGHVQASIAALLDPRLGVVCTAVDADPRNLYPEERSSIIQAIPRRQREFAAGRAAAREAMACIGVECGPVPSGPDRAPIWPLGLVGSISHTRQICIAAVGRAKEVGAIGIDVEERLPVGPDLWHSICTPEEQTYLQGQPEEQRGDIVTQLFSAKEAFYKWQFPLTRRLLDFQDVQVNLEPGGGGFSVRPVDALRWPDVLAPVTGGMFSDQKWVIAWVCGHPGRPRVSQGMRPGHLQAALPHHPPSNHPEVLP